MSNLSLSTQDDSQGGIEAGSDKHIHTATPQSPQFTGSGKEYFRIWILNLFLSVVTLGIYSAWAKVRRLQYFDQNTHFDGANFQFHGNPKNILIGRLIAVALLFTYSTLAQFSHKLLLGTFVFLMLALPWMLRSALRFRCANTSYRGIRFEFTGTVFGAYFVTLPFLLVFLLPGVIFTIWPNKPVFAILPVILYPFIPYFHAKFKDYQLGNVRYAGIQSSTKLTGGSFYGPYLLVFGGSFGLGILAAIVFGIFIALQSKGIGNFGVDEGGIFTLGNIAFFVGGIVLIYTFYIVMGPYMQARIFTKSMSALKFGEHEVHANMTARSFIKLQTKNTILTLLSLGLYRPFAVVSVHQFRLQKIHFVPLVWHELHNEKPSRVAGTSEGSADMFGFDFSW